MRCTQARRLMEMQAAQGIGPDPERQLAEHLAGCPECSGLARQLDRVWDALAWHPRVEPSPDFLPRLRARIRAEEETHRSGRPPAWQWRWAALGAAVLLAIAILSRQGGIQPPVAITPDGASAAMERDSWDEQFLEELEQTLHRSDADLLSTYDSWPASAQEPAISPYRAVPERNSKRKEIS